MAIQDIIDEYLLEEQNEPRTRSGLWSPSSFGRCFRNQFWNRKDEPQSNPMTGLALRQTSRGKLTHKWMQGILLKKIPSARAEVEVKTADIHTFIDIVTNEEAIEIKSQRGRAYEATHYKSQTPITQKHYGHFLQTVSGAIHTERDVGRLIYVNAETHQAIEYRFPITGEAVGKFEAELRELNSYWPNELPPAKPRAFPNKQGISQDCQYCSFRDKCNRRELGGT